jgi:hypothetical protein
LARGHTAKIEEQHAVFGKRALQGRRLGVIARGAECKIAHPGADDLTDAFETEIGLGVHFGG